jgi:hypothetical protein
MDIGFSLASFVNDAILLGTDQAAAEMKIQDVSPHSGGHTWTEGQCKRNLLSGNNIATAETAMRVRLAVGFALGAMLSAGSVNAVTFGFSNCVSNNSVTDCATAGQYSFDVLSVDSNTVSFKFSNAGPSASSITDIYFDDNGLFVPPLSVAASSAGVSFSVNATPGNLPAGNNASPPFVTTVGLSADSDAPAQPNGVNPGEWVQLNLDLASGKNFNSVLTDLGNANLRVGIHVQGFAAGGSESFISAVPEPQAYLMAFAALGVLTVFGRRRFLVA